MERRWAAAAAALILVGGIAIASYLVVHHENQVYGDAKIGLANCPQTDLVNCDVVNTSRWSEIAGLPIAALAVPTYLLLLGLIATARKNPAASAYVFGIGLLTVLYSVALFVISKTMIGYLCLWCMRLYAVNLAIPILAWWGARRSPAALLSTLLTDLRRWPKPMRRAAAAFAVLLALTVAGDRALRSHVRAVAAAERAKILEEGGPTVPAVPPPAREDPSDGRPRSFLFGALVPDATAAEPAPSPGSKPYKLASPVKRLAPSASGLKSAIFDLQARVGAGTPVALIFWAPGYVESERTLAEMTAFFRKEAPRFEVYAIAGLRDDQREEEIVERAGLYDLPADLPLLADPAYRLTTALGAGDVPNVALFSSKGQLVIAKIKDRGQKLITESGNRPAEDVIREVAQGGEVAQIQRMFPYYPSARLLDRCAPSFRGRAFGAKTPFEFTGRSATGRPTLVLFWSSTCAHCRIDIPQFVQWLRKHPNTVDVVGVTVIKKDKEGQPSHRAITDAYIKAEEIPWLNVEDEGGVISERYGITTTPTTAFVSPSGAIRELWYYAHDEGFDKAMDLALAKAKTAGDSACRSVDPGPAPTLSMSVVGDDGKRVELATLLDRPALVHFWATWCKPCVEELPALMKFKAALEKDAAGRVLLVSVEGEADGPRIKQFGKGLKLDLRSYRAPRGGLADRLDVGYRLPRTFVVNAGGAVSEVKQGSQDWSDPVLAGAVRARLAAGARAAR